MSEHISGHGKAVASMFGRIVPWYDMLNTLLSGGMDGIWRRRLVREVRPLVCNSTGRVLDLAAGTLGVALALHRRWSHMTIPAMDFCPPMLVRGQQKLQGDALVRIFPVAADAKCLPLPDACVDAVTMAFGIRNILPRQDVFREMLRVLAPGGRACILEFGSGKNRIWGGIYNVYMKKILPAIGRVISGDVGTDGKGDKGGKGGAYTYLAESICAFPTAMELEEEMRAAGFATAWHIPLSSGIVCLHMAEKLRNI